MGSAMVTLQGRDWPLARCRSCKAPIVWVANRATGKGNPLDPHPVDDGNIVLDGVMLNEHGNEVPAVKYLKRGEDPGPVTRYVSHFSTCENADRHRRK